MKFKFVLSLLFVGAGLTTAYSQTVGRTGAPCVGEDIVFYLDGNTCSQWSWTVTGGSITSGQGTSTIHVTYSSATTSNVEVYAFCSGSNSSYQLNGNVISAKVTPAVSLSASPTPICRGSSITLAATPTNGGGSPSYKYYVDGSLVQTTSSASYNYNTSGLSGGSHSTYVIMTSSVVCVTSTTATSSTQNFSVTVPDTYTANISGPSLICQGTTSITLVATTGGSSGNLTYEWFRGGSSQGAPSSSNSKQFNSITNGETMYCKVYSGDACVVSPVQTSNYTVSITSTVTPTLSIQTSTNSICAGGTLTFTAREVICRGHRINGS